MAEKVNNITVYGHLAVEFTSERLVLQGTPKKRLAKRAVFAQVSRPRPQHGIIGYDSVAFFHDIANRFGEEHPPALKGHPLQRGNKRGIHRHFQRGLGDAPMPLVVSIQLAVSMPGAVA